MVKPKGLWSRPSLPWAIGVRPNSPPQITSVESSRPRDLRSFNSPAMGLSTARALAARAGFLAAQVGHRLGAAAEQRALEGGGQKAVVETVEAAGRDHAAAQDDEAGQVAADAAQAVGDPGAHARPALLAVAGVQEI